jgi:hypothetical protein
MCIYRFFDDFLLFLAAFFFVAIMLTTFRAVRDLSVAHPWHQVPDRSGKLACVGGGESEGRRRLMTILH